MRSVVLHALPDGRYTGETPKAASKPVKTKASANKQSQTTT